MFSKKEIWKEIRPNLPQWLDESEREEINKEIGDYFVTTMLDLIGEGVSPVNGGGKFEKLSKEYADEEKGGDRNPNMELYGDMLGALTYEADAYSVKVGIWDEDQAVKAYGHTTGFKGHPFLEGKAPARKLIPTDKETFLKIFKDGMDAIIEEKISAYKDSEEAQSS